MNKRLIILIGIILVIAAFLRFYKIEPFMTFLGDQGRDATIVKRIITFEHFPAIGAPSSVGQIYLGPFYYYLIAPFLLLFNYNPAGLGYGVAILAMIFLIYITYRISREFDGFFAAVFLACMTFSFSLIDLSRFSWNPNLLPYFTFLALFFFYKWITRNSWINSLLFGSFLAFAFQLHYLTLLIFVPVGGYYIYTLVTLKDKSLFLKETMLAVGSFLFFSVPLILFDLKHDFLNSKNFIALFTENKISSDSSYILKLQDTVQGFFLHTLQINTSFVIGIVLLILFSICGYVLAKKQKNHFINLNILLVISYILEFALLSSPRHIHYFGPVYISFYFILVCMLYLIPKQNIRYIAGILIVIAFISLQYPHYYFFNSQPGNQIHHAKTVAKSFDAHITKEPIQLVALPFTETDGHYRYFLELQGHTILPIESAEQPEELYVLCFEGKDCKPLDDPHWQIAAFYNKMLADSWSSDGVTIYKIVHKKNE